MRIASSVRHNRLLLFVILILFLAAPMLFGGSHDPHTYAADNHTSYRTQKSTISKAAMIDPTKLVAHNVQHAFTHQKSIPAFANHASIANTQIPVASNLPLDNTAGHLLRNFPGLTSADNTSVNGYPSEPPDQGLCINSSSVMESINQSLAFYQRNGTSVSGPIAMNAFFGETPGLSGEITFDPRCYFDAQTHAWFATVTAIDPDFQHSHLDIAVNPTSNPLNSWTIYRIDTTEPADSGCPCYADFPVFGIDQFNIYLSPNEGTFSGPPGNGGEIFAISKSDLVSLASSVHQVRFSSLHLAGILAETISPAYTDSIPVSEADAAQPPAEHFVNSLFRTASDHRLGIWAMANQQAVASGGTPQLSSIAIDSEAYAHPPLVPTPNGYVLTTNDARIMQVQFINGELWVSLETALRVPGSSSTTAGPAWFEIRPQLSSDGSGLKIDSASIVHQGYISTTRNYLLTPTIEVSPAGTTVMVMTLSGPDTFPSIVYTVRSNAEAQFGPVHIAAAGVENIEDFGCTPAGGGVCSWGDYTAAVLDASNGGATIWMAGEYISGPTVSQENWGTRIMEISAED